MEHKKAEALYRNSIKVLKRVQLKSGGCLATRTNAMPLSFVRKRKEAKIIDRLRTSLSIVNRRSILRKRTRKEKERETQILVHQA